jgi:PAS domain S-box-containing protein
MMDKKKRNRHFTYSLYTIEDLMPGNHLCCIYETEEEHRALVTPFLRKGLELGQKVMYIVDAHTAETILGYLEHDGVDVKQYLEGGQLLILTQNESYMRNGVFSPDDMINLLRSETEKVLAEGYTALRVTGEMTWALHGLPGSERLIEYETRLNNFFPGSKCLAICQYDKRRFSPAVLMDVLHTHPIAVLGTKVYDNPFYIPPAEMLSQDLPALKLNHWLRYLTERKQVEEALRESMQRLQTVIDHTAAVMWAINKDGIYIFLEGKGLEALGLKPGEMVGQSLFEIYADNKQIIEDARRALSGETFYSCTEVGGIIWENRYVPLMNDKGIVTGAIGVAVDVTDTKKMQQALIESEARYRYIVENVPTGICEVDLSTFKFIQVNDVMCDILGYTEDEFLAMDPAVLFAGESKKHVVERLSRMRTGEKIPVPFEYKIKTNDGRELWVLVNSQLIYEDDKPVRTLTIAQDISERKRLELKLQYAQKMETISTLASGIAHEFNNSLMILSGSAETLHMRLPENEKVKRFAEITRNSIERMVQLTDQLMAYARSGNYQAKTIYLPDFVRAALLVIRHHIKPGIFIETDLPRDILNINGDLAQLQMVIAAVIQNASDAIKKEGRIRIKVRNETIDRETAKRYPGFAAGTYVSLAIEDDGKGMTEEIKEKIFEPFFTTKVQASGLSMSAVYGIVKNHSGFIYVESEIDKGTVVRLYFPPSEYQVKKAKTPK